MSAFAAVLRAVNVGGNNKVPMAELRAAAEKTGLKNVRSLLQSGNLVFDAGTKSAAACEKLLQTACTKAFGLTIDIHVRGPSDLAAILARNPFAKEAEADPGRLHVLFLRDAPGAATFKALQAAIKGRETVHGDGRHAYIFYPDGAGQSKLTLGAIEKALGTRGTARNWNTVTKLAAMLAA